MITPKEERDLRALLDAAEDTFRHGFFHPSPLYNWAHNRKKEREYETDERTAT